MKKQEDEEKSLAEKKAELEEKLKEIQSEIDKNSDDNNEEPIEKEEKWIKVVRKVIIGLWGVIILVVVGIIALYTYSNYLDKVIAEKQSPEKSSYITDQNSVDLNSIELTTPGFTDNNTVNEIPTFPDSNSVNVNQ